jgi:hypothetical protein
MQQADRRLHHPLRLMRWLLTREGAEDDALYRLRHRPWQAGLPRSSSERPPTAYRLP